MEWLTLGLFCAALLVCLVLDISILAALVFGLCLFLLYGKRKGFTWRELIQMALDGVKTVKNILFTFLLIGMLTALWRAAGTIPVIVCYASALIRPSVFLLMTFLLNCAVSSLTGTSFGTAATMGIICATMARSMGCDIRLVGGAVLSGAFFGDRCSPVSTSALLVAELTGTDIFDNIRRMLRSALVPFLLTTAVYALLGLTMAPAGEMIDLKALFLKRFSLHWTALLPALTILLFSAFRVNVRLTMAASILSAIPVCILLQHSTPAELARAAVFGFYESDAELGAMINDGGIASMVKVGGIVCLSSSYSGIFRKTGLLDGTKHGITVLSEKTTPFAAIFCTSVVVCIISCNQSLATIVTSQLCAGLRQDAPVFANDLEDTTIVIAPLVPWSIAGGVPLAIIGAPSSALLLACYLYLIPLWRLACSFRLKQWQGLTDRSGF